MVGYDSIALHHRPCVRQNAGLTSTFLVAFLLWPSDAYPCDFPPFYPRLAYNFVMPEDGDVDVPVNAVVFVGSAHVFEPEEVSTADETAAPAAIVLRPAGEATVDVDGSQTLLDGSQTLLDGSSGSVAFFHSDEPLLPDTDYEIWVDEERLSTFTTGASEDDTPPGEVDFDVVSTQGGRYAAISCDRQAPGAVLDVNADDAVLIVSSSDWQNPILPPFHGGVHDAFEAGEHFLRADTTATLRVQMMAIDQAGNTSSWSEPTEIELPPESCTCSSTSGTSLQVGLILALGFFRQRRRRSIASAQGT